MEKEKRDSMGVERIEDGLKARGERVREGA